MSQTGDGPLQYSFSEAAALDDTRRVVLLGGKGSALARMTAMALPVPPGFTLTTAACRRVLDGGWFPALDEAIADGIASIESSLRRRFGDPTAPLLVSVRSGAPVSMPGMMDTVLNTGMTDEIAVALGRLTGDERFGWDTARRFLQSYATVVSGAAAVDVARWAEECFGADDGRDLEVEELPSAVAHFRAMLSRGGLDVPSDPATQLREAVGAVFNSWDSERAKVYRRVEGIEAELGTAATVQAMTFGHLGTASGTGVAFTRDPSTGAPGLVGDFLVAPKVKTWSRGPTRRCRSVSCEHCGPTSRSNLTMRPTYSSKTCRISPTSSSPSRMGCSGSFRSAGESAARGRLCESRSTWPTIRPSPSTGPAPSIASAPYSTIPRPSRHRSTLVRRSQRSSLRVCPPHRDGRSASCAPTSTTRSPAPPVANR